MYQMLTTGTFDSFIAVSSSFVSLLNEQSAVLSKQLEAGGLNWYGNTSVGIFNSSASPMLLSFAYSIFIMKALVVLKISPAFSSFPLARIALKLKVMYQNYVFSSNF